MATPVIELHERLRRAGMVEEQAAAVTAAFEALNGQIVELTRRLERVESKLRLHTWLLGLILAAVLAPYVAALFGLTGATAAPPF